MSTDRHEEFNNASAVVPLIGSEAEIGEGRDDAALYRKLEWRLVPIPFLISVICYVDRTNISLAAMDFMRDLSLSQKAYGTGAGLFFIPYMLFQIPSNYLLQKVGAPLWLGIILIGWGVSSACMSLVTNEVGYYVLRVLLGVFEAGAFPGVFYYFTLFFPERKLTLPIAWGMAGSYFAMAISSPLAAGLLMLEGVGGWHGWQWLFLLEGIPAIILGFVTMACLPKDPSRAAFLSSTEKAILQKEVGMGYGECARNGCLRSGSSWDMRGVWKVVSNLQLWWVLIAATLTGIMRYVGMFWTPLWIQGLANGSGMDLDNRDIGREGKVGSVEVALLSTIPYTMAVIASILLGWSCTRFKERKLHACLSCILSSVLFVLMILLAKVDAVLAFVMLTLGSSAANGAGAIMIALLCSCFWNQNRAFGFAFCGTIGNVGGYIGPQFTGVLVDATDSYSVPVYLAAGLLLLAGLMFLCSKDTIREEREEGC